MVGTFTLDSFKELVNNSNFTEKITGRSDIIDMDNGTMIIYSEHINKYLEQYICKDIEDLENTLWYNYGVFLKVID